MYSDTLTQHLEDFSAPMNLLNDLMIFLRSLITNFMTIDPPIKKVETQAAKKVKIKTEIYSNSAAVTYPVGHFQLSGKLKNIFFIIQQL